MTHTSSHTDAPAPEEDVSPTVTDVLWWARRKGIRLELTGSKDGIMAGPRRLLTREFREAVQAVNPWLIRHLLVDEAMRYYARYVWSDGLRLDSPAAQAGYTAMSAVEDHINAIFDEADLEGFRDELRNWLKAGLAAYRDASRDRRTTDAAAYAETTDDGPWTNGEQAPGDFPQEDPPEAQAPTGEISLLNAVV